MDRSRPENKGHYLGPQNSLSTTSSSGARNDQSYSSTHYQQQRGRGDSRGRGQGGDRGGAGGFPSKPVVVASTRPGNTCTLVSNHFRLNIRNTGLVYIYKIDWGTLG